MLEKVSIKHFHKDRTDVAGGGTNYSNYNLNDVVRTRIDFDVFAKSEPATKGLVFNIANKTIKRLDGGSFVGDGFLVGNTFKTINAFGKTQQSFTKINNSRIQRKDLKNFSLDGFVIGDVCDWLILKVGTITSLTSSPTINGVATTFLSTVAIGDKIYTTKGILVGTVFSITSNLILTLTANALVAVSGERYLVNIPFRILDIIGTSGDSDTLVGETIAGGGSPFVTGTDQINTFVLSNLTNDGTTYTIAATTDDTIAVTGTLGKNGHFAGNTHDVQPFPVSLNLTSTFTDLEFFYNHLIAEEGEDYKSKIDTAGTQKYFISGLDGAATLPAALTPMDLPSGSQGWVTGTAQIKSTTAAGFGTTHFEQSFQIELIHKFIENTPLEVLQTPPYLSDDFLDGSCLGFISQVIAKFSPAPVTPSFPHISNWNTELGNTGAYNENFDTGSPKYSLAAAPTYKNGLVVIPTIQLFPQVATTVEFTINAASALFNNILTQGILEFRHIPKTTAQYTNTFTTNYQQNFRQDKVILTVGAAAANGEQNTTAYQTIKNATLVFVSTTVMNVKFDVDFSAANQTFWEGLAEDDRNFEISFSTEWYNNLATNVLLATQKSDAVEVQVATGLMNVDTSDTGLIVFLFNDYAGLNQGVNGVGQSFFWQTGRVSAEPIAFSHFFGINSNSRDLNKVQLNNLTMKLVAEKKLLRVPYDNVVGAGFTIGETISNLSNVFLGILVSFANNIMVLEAYEDTAEGWNDNNSLQGLTSLTTADINGVSTEDTPKQFVLDSFNYNLFSEPRVLGLTQIDYTEKIKDEIVISGVLTNENKIIRRPDLDALGYKLYEIQFATWIGYEYWQDQVGADPEFFDITQPPLYGLNKEIFHYQNVPNGWQIKYQIELTTIDNQTIKQGDNTYKYVLPAKVNYVTGTKGIFNYNTNPDWITKSIKTYDPDTLVQNQIGGIDYIRNDKDTRVQVVLEATGTTPPVGFLNAQLSLFLMIEVFEGDGRSSIFAIGNVFPANYIKNNIWKSPTGFIDTTTIPRVGDKVTGIAFIDYKMLPKDKKYTIFAFWQLSG